jgi:hypothetical protein
MPRTIEKNNTGDARKKGTFEKSTKLSGLRLEEVLSEVMFRVEDERIHYSVFTEVKHL